MADTWLQEQNRLRNRRKQKNLVYQQGAPFFGYITGSHEPDNETVTVQYPGGERKIRALHPYVGTDSWLRVGAESGQPVIMAQRPDSNEPEILAYAFRNAKDRTDDYGNGIGLYRPLTPGEMEAHSKGLAQTYWSRRPLLEQRGGLIRDWLDQDSLTSGSKAPTHVRQLHLHKSGAFGDEERFGIVQRPLGATKRTFVRASRTPDPALTAKVTAAAATSGVIATPGPWAKEYSRVIRSGALFPPVLVDLREGDVIDDLGVPLNLALTGNPMRFKGEWFCDSPTGGVMFIGIDNQGNLSVALPNEATTGADLKIPSGDLTVSIGKSHVVSVQKDYSIVTSAGSMTLDCSTDLKATTKTGSMTFESAANVQVKCLDLKMDADTAELIKNADVWMVRGDDLKNWIEQTLKVWTDTHVHPTGVGPSGPPASPLTAPMPTILSSVAKVK